VIVLFVNVVNAYKSKKLQRNVKRTNSEFHRTFHAIAEYRHARRELDCASQRKYYEVRRGWWSLAQKIIIVFFAHCVLPAAAVVPAAVCIIKNKARVL